MEVGFYAIGPRGKLAPMPYRFGLRRHLADAVDVRTISDEDIFDAYREHGGVHKAAKALNVGPYFMHTALQRMGRCDPVNILTADDAHRLICEYEAHAGTGTLAVLAQSMGRTKQYISRHARALALTEPARKRPYLVGVSSRNMRLWHSKNPHPRGMLGKRHSEATKDAISQHSFNRWHSMTKAQQIAFVSNAHEKWRAGWREIGGKRNYYRSRWEANYARYLEWLRLRGEIRGWEHEPETFWFEAIRRGTRSYLIDFKVTEGDGSIYYHEVKGWMDPKSKTKLKRMAKYHPHIKLVLVDGKVYKAIARVVERMIPGWE